MAETEGRPAGPQMPLHRPAMVAQVLDALSPAPGHVALDLTVGTGGHALRLAHAVGPEGLLVGIDADPRALETARRRLKQHAPCPFRLFHARFSRVREVADRAGVDGFDLALADLGVGTHQLDDPDRGFSFDSTARLDMRYDTARRPSAYEVVNQTAESELADILYEYGEERYSRQIAARICRERPVETPAELSGLVKSVVARRTPRRRTWRIHPATRVMMALRIYVNQELAELEALLEALPDVMAPGGRLAVITYHSLEARRVKQAWRRQQEQGLLQMASPPVVMPSEQEVEQNPRVRSAQLRAARMRGGTA